MKACSDRTRGNGFSESRFRLDIKKEFLYNEGGETPWKFTQTSCGCPFNQSVQGQGEWHIEQPDLVRDVLSHGRGMGLDDL